MQRFYVKIKQRGEFYDFTEQINKANQTKRDKQKHSFKGNRNPIHYNRLVI